MSLAAFADRMCRLMPALLHRAMGRPRNYLARGLLTMPQLHVLLCLSESGPRPMRDVGRRLGIGPSTVTGHLDHLVAMGLALRLPGQKDRRVVRADLTPKGRKVLATILEERKKIVMKVFGNLTAAERAAYLDILEKLNRRTEDNGPSMV